MSGFVVGGGKKLNFAGFSETNSRKNGWFRGNFRDKFRWKTIARKRPISWKFSGHILPESNRFTVLHWFDEHFQLKDGNLPIFVWKWWLLSYAITTVSETPTACKCCLCKPGDFARKFQQLVNLGYHTRFYLLDMRFFLKVIIICYFTQCTQEMRQ